MTNPEPKLTLVRYYLDGWRVGYLIKDSGHTAVIQPIAAKGGAVPRLIRIPSDDIIIQDAVK